MKTIATCSFVVALLALLGGCATGPAAPVSDAGEGSGQVLETDPSSESPAQTEPRADDDRWRPAPEGASTSSAPAVAALLKRATNAYQNSDYQRAIASAERALRIDRRNPEVYLLLAQSYWRLAIPAQSEQFARQGLKYSASDPGMTRSLQRVLSQVVN